MILLNDTKTLNGVLKKAYTSAKVEMTKLKKLGLVIDDEVPRTAADKVWCQTIAYPFQTTLRDSKIIESGRYIAWVYPTYYSIKPHKDDDGGDVVGDVMQIFKRRKGSNFLDNDLIARLHFTCIVVGTKMTVNMEWVATNNNVTGSLNKKIPDIATFLKKNPQPVCNEHVWRGSSD